MLVGKRKTKTKIIKNEKLKNIHLKIHELSSREFQKSIGLRDFGATMQIFRNGDLKININNNWFFINSIPFRNGIIYIHPKIRAQK